MERTEMIETMETEHGLAEARKDRGDDFWFIGYPWGDDRFAGSRAELRREMKRVIAVVAEQEEKARQMNKVERKESDLA